MTLFPRNWRDDMQDVASAIDEDLGAESVKIIPMREAANVNAQFVPDAMRQPYDTVAIYSNRATVVKAGDYLQLSSTDPWFSIRLESMIIYRPRQGDRIFLVRTGDTFEIKKSEPDGVSSVRFFVNTFGVKSIGQSRVTPKRVIL